MYNTISVLFSLTHLLLKEKILQHLQLFNTSTTVLTAKPEMIYNTVNPLLQFTTAGSCPRTVFLGFRTNVISGFKKIVSLPEGINSVFSQDFNDQKRLVLAVFECYTQFLSLFHALFDSVLSRTSQSFVRYSQLNVKCAREPKTYERALPLAFKHKS